jgi:hypothetical protein
MIYADLRGKISVAEDVFTSNVFGLLFLLPGRDLLDFLTFSHTSRRERLFLRVVSEPKLKIDFWPYLTCPRVCIPDAILTVESRTSAPLRLIIEAKIGAAQTGDQLADYWRAGNIRYPNRFELIYLTDHRSTPKRELEESETRAGAGAKIYWLNWYSLFQWVQQQLSDGLSRPYSEKQILGLLKNYLSDKGYQTFLTWRPWASLMPTSYRRKYMCSADQLGVVRGSYVHRYFDQRLGKIPPPPYVLQHSENPS